jgi:hypothetical protein
VQEKAPRRRGTSKFATSHDFHGFVYRHPTESISSQAIEAFDGQFQAVHLGVNLQTEEERAMWKLLQDQHAMMDCIAVPGFLAAYQ